jgi:predicted RNA-binding Zn ribbon-like protein
MANEGPYAFSYIGGAAALDFVNTVAWRDGEARERLETLADVKRWADGADLPGASVVGLKTSDLREIRATRETLHAVFRPPALGFAGDPAALEELSRRLASLARHRRLAWLKDGAEWRLSPSAPAATRFLAPLLDSAAALLTDGGAGRVKLCEGPQCGWLFLDRSSRAQRRWCRMADCGNRAKAQRHYRRLSPRP